MTLAVVLVPLLTALLLSVLRGGFMVRLLALLSTIATFILALGLPGSAAINRVWIPGFGVNFALVATGAASVLVLVAALVMIPTSFYAGLRITRRQSAFLALLLGMQAFLNGMFLAKDLVLFYVFWEATLIPSVLMLGVWGLERRREAAMKYLIYAVSGSFLMLISIITVKVYSGAASFHIADLLQATPMLPLETQLWIFAGFAIAFAVKLPLFPLHAWLPDFHTQNHPSGAADVAGTLYKAGGFGFFAWAIPLLPLAAQEAAPILLGLAAITALYAAVIAAGEDDLKRLLAYASLSHMGFVGVGVFALQITGLNGGMYLFAAQMVTTGGLFLLSGMLHQRRNTFQLSAFGGLARSAPALAGIMLFVLFASVGVPGLANFPGEFLSLLGAFLHTPTAAVVATLAVIAAGVYCVNLYQRLFQGREEHSTHELSAAEILVLAPIVLGVLWLGLNPAPQLERIEMQSALIGTQLELAQDGAMTQLAVKGQP
jgi:NADH-quinone oxidoreductase subunit M